MPRRRRGLARLASAREQSVCVGASRCVGSNGCTRIQQSYICGEPVLATRSPDWSSGSELTLTRTGPGRAFIETQSCLVKGRSRSIGPAARARLPLAHGCFAVEMCCNWPTTHTRAALRSDPPTVTARNHYRWVGKVVRRATEHQSPGICVRRLRATRATCARIRGAHTQQM